MKIRTLLLMLMIALLMVACSNNDDAALNEIETTDDLKALVDDYSTGNYTDEVASITSTELIVTDSKDEETTYDLPDDEFFVSIAPFLTETHPCTIHSLTGCQGELVDADFDFHIEDEAGNVVVSETYNSDANGFVDLWLPRDQSFTVKVRHDDKEVISEISTFENDGTCITTMQLM